MLTFGFLVVCHATPETEIVEVVGELLTEATENVRRDFENPALACVMSCRHQRLGDEFTDRQGRTTRLMLADIVLDLEETEVAKDLIEEFIALFDASPIIHHVVKFEDPLLQKELDCRAAEIFAIEMKLRRVLSFIYMHAYQGKDPFDLLLEETVKPMEKPTDEQMKIASENQFFHLTFSQYVKLNQRKRLQTENIVDAIRDSDQYDAFRSEILRTPVENEDDAALLAGLREIMDPIERMRNCVAHNRQPSDRITENYLTAYARLNGLLDQYMARW